MWTLHKRDSLFCDIWAGKLQGHVCDVTSVSFCPSQPPFLWTTIMCKVWAIQLDNLFWRHQIGFLRVRHVLHCSVFLTRVASVHCPDQTSHLSVQHTQSSWGPSCTNFICLAWRRAICMWSCILWTHISSILQKAWVFTWISLAHLSSCQRAQSIPFFATPTITYASARARLLGNYQSVPSYPPSGALRPALYVCVTGYHLGAAIFSQPSLVMLGEGPYLSVGRGGVSILVGQLGSPYLENVLAS